MLANIYVLIMIVSHLLLQKHSHSLEMPCTRQLLALQEGRNEIWSIQSGELPAEPLTHSNLLRCSSGSLTRQHRQIHRFRNNLKVRHLRGKQVPRPRCQHCPLNYQPLSSHLHQTQRLWIVIQKLFRGTHSPHSVSYSREPSRMWVNSILLL